MDTQEYVQRRVAECYWQDDINCATTSLRILSDVFQLRSADQLSDAAVGMHGAGKYGAQCGLVEGSLMFIGVLGRRSGIPDSSIVSACNDFARQFENRFGSMLCSVFRPAGFNPSNPPHLCEKLTCEAVSFCVDFMHRFLSEHDAAAGHRYLRDFGGGRLRQNELFKALFAQRLFRCAYN